ncbi:FtsX-like permease family protein [Paralimibaculum aggregatum]|uniref:FtsX-like permease family protein n=1 Tax=Paralimibaculum aggregatum TaxID=3036245 RepID=A0ABQ6LHS1_9RHOB|nr:cell division protein FtsX [Limibaculum sp. NKW23]GMG82830.1 FtsX-like permease family protein [Limibaculum sp. NKW23]
MARWFRFARAAEAPPIVPMSGWSAPLTTLASAAMSFLAVLTLIAGLAADRLAEDWRQDLAGLATVRVSAEPEVLETRVMRALEVVRTAPGIAAARVLSEAEHLALIAPWIGGVEALEALPAPRLIDLTLEGDGPDAARLQSRLDRDAPGAVYDDHAAWRGPLARAAAAVGRLAWAATVLVMLAACAMVALAAQATLTAHLDIVRVIRLIGGEDRYIAGAFVRRLALRGLAGGMAGAGLALLALAALPGSGAGGVLGGLLPGTFGWIAIPIAVPLLTAAIAWATARASVRIALGRML